MEIKKKSRLLNLFMSLINQLNDKSFQTMNRQLTNCCSFYFKE